MKTELCAYVEPAARAARLIAALLTAVVCLRFSALVVEDRLFMSADRSRAGETVNKSAPDQGGEKKKGKKNDRERENGRPVLSNKLLNLLPFGETMRVGISVSVRGTRSIVYVNDRRRGRTPFIGDVECKKGATIQIRLEPEGGRGRPRSIQRACDTEVIYIRE